MRIVSGTARGRRIEAPPGTETRPTLDRVRENLFNMLQAEVPEAQVLDLFAGSGALSLEALSRGARKAVLVDHSRAAFQCQRANIRTLGFEDRAESLLMEWQQAVSLLCGRGDRFDLVFLDPPYRMMDLRDEMNAILPLLADRALVIAEHEARKPVLVPTFFYAEKQRSWGFCGVTIYRLTADSRDGNP